jgi:hypothetical protein
MQNRSMQDRSQIGGLNLAKCLAFTLRPGQHWTYILGSSVTTNVQVNLGSRMGGCWEITGCQTADDASVGTSYGCKGPPKPDAKGCDLNGEQPVE